MNVSPECIVLLFTREAPVKDVEYLIKYHVILIEGYLAEIFLVSTMKDFKVPFNKSSIVIILKAA